MSVLFNGTTQYLTTLTLPVGSYPFTFNCWIRHLAVSNQSFMSYSANGGGTNAGQYLQNAAAASQGRFVSRTNADLRTAATTPAPQDTWSMLTGVAVSDTERIVYLNGGSKVSEPGNAIFAAALNQFEIGVLQLSATRQFFNGYVAESAIWNTDLSDGDVASLYQAGVAVPADNVQPGNLVFYASYQTSFTSEIGVTLTPIGGPTIDPDHPPLVPAGPDPPVPYTQWQPSRLRACWTTPDGVNLKRSHTTDSYSGGNPTAVTDLKPSIADYASGNLKSGLTIGGDIKASILKPS